MAHLNQALIDGSGFHALSVANTWIKARESRPFEMFVELEHNPQAQYICYKFMDRLGWRHPSGRAAAELLAGAC
jgi:hypothetical protein